MLKSFFTIALRNLVKSPGLSGIKVISLCIGVCGCMIVFFLARLELSFDKHHTKSDNIYRIYSRFSGDYEGNNRGVPLPFPSLFSDRATGVDAVSQVLTYNWNVSVDNNGTQTKFPSPNKIAFVDDNYFKVFPDYRWISGEPNALRNPYSVVLTESKAKIYFGDKDASNAVGKSLTYSDSLHVTVAGIIADPAYHTDFDFTDFISLPTARITWVIGKEDFERWGNINSSWMCMIRLTDGTPTSKIEEILTSLAKEKDERDAQAIGQKITTFTNFSLQPISDIHFNTEVGTWDEGRSTTSAGTIEALGAFALMLLIVAVINFVNLETAQSLLRAREVGLRKLMGGTRWSLVTFFVAESFVITFIAVALSVPLAQLCIIFFSEFLPKELSVDLLDPVVPMFIVGLTAFVSIISGAYPALVLSSYQPVVALRGNRNNDRSGSAFIRKILTVFQFTFSQALIAGAMIIGLQISWMLDKDLGFSREAVVTIQPPWWEKSVKRGMLKNELEQLSEVDMVSQNARPPSAGGSSSASMVYNNGQEDIAMTVYFSGGDTAYIRMFGLQLVAGRNVQPVDSLMEVIVNEMYCERLGLEPIDMIGKDISSLNRKKRYHVVGVVKDFHHVSLHKTLEPWYYASQGNSYFISARLAKGTDYVAGLDKIKAASKKIYGDSEAQITFLDDAIQKFYENEKRISKLANTATALAIFISCLGLLGLASFTAIQRTKEIGIRKVLGASVTGIVTLLSREFILLVIVSLVIATPIAWYSGNQWLDTFPYRMNITIWLFLGAGAISVVIALITVGFQAVKAAVVNPVESLRYE
jgi:putative ABC transport system permease protein